MTPAFLAVLFMAAGASASDIIATVSDEAGKPVEDAVVFVYELPGNFHPPKLPAIMDQIDKELVPHVLPVLVGTKVKFPNKDNIHHQLYSFSKAKEFELPLYKGKEPRPIVMDKVGVVKLGCNIHDWMLGYIFVLENPYFAATDSKGQAVLKGVPKGKHAVAVWSERLKGSVDDTRQDVVVGRDAVLAQFRLRLSPKKKSTRTSLSY